MKLFLEKEMLCAWGLCPKTDIDQPARHLASRASSSTAPGPFFKLRNIPHPCFPGLGENTRSRGAQSLCLFVRGLRWRRIHPAGVLLPAT